MNNVKEYDKDAGIIEGPFEDCDCPSHHQHGRRGCQGCPICNPPIESAGNPIDAVIYN